jgi:hypothetical protein
VVEQVLSSGPQGGDDGQGGTQDGTTSGSGSA